MTRMQRKLNEIENVQDIERIGDVINTFNNSNITKIFSDSFRGKQWGLRKGEKDGENMIESMKRASQSEGASFINKINVPTTKKMTKPSVRTVQPSQIGFVCPVETPDSEACGLVKHTAITCRISIDTGENLIRRYLGINKLVSFSRRHKEDQSVLLLNGVLLGWCDGEQTRQSLIKARRNNSINVETCIYFDKAVNELVVFTNSSRPLRPLLVVEYDSKLKRHVLVIDKKNLWGSSYETLLSEGAVEYIDSLEQRSTYIVSSVAKMEYVTNTIKEKQIKHLQFLETLKVVNDNPSIETLRSKLSTDYEFDTWEEYKKKALEDVSSSKAVLENLIADASYTHCELDPTAILGMSVTLIPKGDMNQGPRLIYQSSMGKQALGVVHSTLTHKMEGSKALNYPTKSYFSTQTAKWIGMDDLPAGSNAIIAFMSYSGYNQEDAIYVSKEFVENGGFRHTVYHIYKSDNYNNSSRVEEIFKKPPLKAGQDPSVYHAIDENGLPKIEATVNTKDCIIGKVKRTIVNGEVVERNISTFLPLGIEGKVERVVVSSNGGKVSVKVKIRQTKVPIRGDKIASRHAQKSTIGQIIPKSLMPYDEETGVTPDLIINEKCMPSRMTVGMLMEIVLSKGAAWIDERVNATAFRKMLQKGGTFDAFQQLLREYGFNDMGYVKMKSGLTGETFSSMIFSGPVYYQVLKHMVQFKYQARGGSGPTSIVTRQPVPGRAKGGGGRFGEMEVWSLISHGSGSLVQDRMCLSSDPYKDVYCKSCGIKATYRSADMQYTCKGCKSNTNDNLGTCTIPYGMQMYSSILGAAGMKISFDFSKQPS